MKPSRNRYKLFTPLSLATLLLLLSGCAGVPWVSGENTQPELYEETDTPPTGEPPLAEYVQSNDEPYVLIGRMILPEGQFQDGGLLISDGKIVQIWEGEIPSNLEDIAQINTHCVIMPGFIDLHNHVAYNFLPLWQTDPAWPNRYAWAKNSRYKKEVSKPYGAAKRDDDLFDEMNKWGEIRGLVGGVTSILGAGSTAGAGILARNIDQKTLGADRVRTNVGDVHQFGCSRGKPLCPEQHEKVQELIDSFDGNISAIFFHLAEGVDQQSRDEFQWLEANDLLRPQVVITHGTALTRAEFDKMATQNMSLIWSPRSNYLLYGDTTDVIAARDAGVKVALAPDWSPSGSDNVLGEIRYVWNKNASDFNSAFTPRDLIAMTTSTPAEIVGLKDRLGVIKVGATADLLVLEKLADDPYSSVVQSDERHVRLVTVNGVPLYGFPSWLSALAVDDAETINIRGRARAIDTTVDTQGKVRKSTETFSQIRALLESAYAPFGELPWLVTQP